MSEYQRVYQKEKMINVSVHLHREHDKDLIEYLAAYDNRQGYIKGLIRADMKRKALALLAGAGYQGEEADEE